MGESMVGHRAALVVFLAFGLACAGLPIPLGDDAEVAAPVDPNVAALLAAEDSEGALTPEARTARIAALTSWIASKSDLADQLERMLGCIGAATAGCETSEAAYERVSADYAAKDPVAVEVADASWAVLVAVRRTYAPISDYDTTLAAFREAWGPNLTVVSVDHGQTSLSVTVPEQEPVAVDLAAALPSQSAVFGLALVDADTAATWLEWGQPDALNTRIAELTGKCPTLGCPEQPAEEPVPATKEPRRGGREPEPEPQAPEPDPVPAAPAPRPTPPPVPREDLDTPDPSKIGKGKAGKGGKAR